MRAAAGALSIILLVNGAAASSAREVDLLQPPAVTAWPDADRWRALRRAWGEQPARILLLPGLGGEPREWLRRVESGRRLRGQEARLVQAGAAPGELSGPLLVIGLPGAGLQAYLSRTPLGACQGPGLGRPKGCGGAAPPGRGETLVVHAINPWDDRSPLVLVAGDLPARIEDLLAEGSWLLRADFELQRDGLRIWSGRFAGGAGSAWLPDPGSVQDLRDRVRSFEAGPFRVVHLDPEVGPDRAREAAARAGLRLSGLLRMLGPGGRLPPARTLPPGGQIDLVLHPDRETKADRTGDPRPDHLEIAAGRQRLHLSLASPEPSCLPLARSAIRLRAARTPPAGIVDGLGVHLCGEVMGRSLSWWKARLEPRDAAPEPVELLDDSRYRALDYLVALPSSGLLVGEALSGERALSTQELLARPEALARRASDAPRALRRDAPGVSSGTSARAIASFIKGVSLAHEGYGVVDGYGSAAAAAQIARLRELGADGIAVTPFAFMPDPGRPDLDYLDQERQPPGSENDMVVLETMQEARRQGMKVMLKPHVWLPRGHWPGEIRMPDEAAWRAFFERYGAFVTHHALLAALGEADLFVVGVEMEQASRRDADWRALIGKVRRLHAGPLTYAANWGREFESLSFWDVLDVAGLDAYYPLSDDPRADDVELSRGAAEVAGRVEEVARRIGRRVILTEVGFPSLEAAWTSPHDERTGRPADAAAQARAYRALLEGFWERPWLAGLFWWKWPTTSPGARPEPRFSPRDSPAQEVLRSWYGKPRPLKAWPSP